MGEFLLDSILKQVIESEYRAQKIISEAQEEKKHLAENLQDEIKKIKEKIFFSVEKKAKEIKASEHKFAILKAEEIIASANVKVTGMKESYRDNKEQWVNLLLDKVLKNDE